MMDPKFYTKVSLEKLIRDFLNHENNKNVKLNYITRNESRKY